MTKQQTKQRIEKLKKAIQRHRYLYHVLDKQEISDSALDSLKKELFDLEQKFPEFASPDSPTQRIGGEPLSKFKKTRHTQRMLSFNDAFSREDMQDWQKRIEKLLTKEEIENLDFFAEPKIDGLAVSLIYKKGVLIRGATRGDGQIGEDVTQNLKTIESIPLKLEGQKLEGQSRDSPRTVPVSVIEVRGEVFITKKNFKRFEKKYANPRNLAAGSVRQLDSKITSKRKLSFLAWQILGEENQTSEYKKLKDLGIKPVEGKYCRNLQEVFNCYEEFQKQRDKLDFQIDGIVVSVNNNKIFQKLGIAGKAPRGAIAYKFPLKQASTIVKDIILQVGRTGALTPVAVLKPVKIAGVVISRATLHNEDELKRLDVRIGDTVIVGRAGDVIPEVLRVLLEMRDGSEKQFVFPKKCPVCGSSAFRKKGESVWRCSNPKCSERQKKMFEHFVSRAGFDIEGLGPKIVEQLLSQGLVSDFSELFRLKQGDLLPLERFAEKSAENLVKSIQSRKKITLPKFIYALGIANIGEQTAIDLAEKFASIENLKKASLQRLERVKDIGPVVALSVYNWFRDESNLKLLDNLKNAGVKIQKAEHKQGPAKLKGRTFVLTGALEALSRDEAKEKIRELGGEVSESISNKTDYLIIGKEPGSKYDKAKKLGVETLTEKEFLKLIQ